jgi:formylglycine-generating enzyme required for sulfatase activity
VRIAAGTLTIAPGDWEATGVVRWHREDVSSFLIDAHEVTEARWARCVADGACPPRPRRGEPALPMTGVDVHDAAGLCAHEGGRLPTEAALAFAAAGPGGRRYPWGPTGFVCRRAAWGLARGPCAEGAVGPEIVGAHPAGATADGVHDLAGNVAEWTSPPAARASLDRARRPGDAGGPIGADGRVAVLGGAWDDVEAAALRTWARRHVPAGERSSRIGFRCAYDTP